MRTRRIAALVASVAATTGVVVGVLAAPGGAQTAPVFTVEKIVDGEATPPEGTEFTVTAVCEGEGAGEFDVTFDAQGMPLGSDTVEPGFTGTCTFTETETGGASNVAYACELSDEEDAACSGGGADPVTITFESAAELTGTVTVTNTFVPPPPPVVIQPVFTG